MSAKKDNIIHEIYEDKFKGCCYQKVHYFINQEKKIIVCKLEPYATQLFFEDMNLSSGIAINREFFEYCCDFDVTFTGKATCLEEDVFNIEFGKKLAYDKAVFKLLAHKRKFFEAMIEVFNDNISEVQQEIANLDASREQVTRRYEAKIKEVTP